MPTHVATHLIMGATAAGKTALIRGFLAERPADEHWAVLMNDFGAARIETRDAVTVREVSGCACCTGQVVLRAALVRMLRDARPRRLFIEASAAARPASVLAVLREEGIASAINLRASVCVVNALHFADARWHEREDYREQIACAARLIVNEGDDAAISALAALHKTAKVIDARDGPVSLSAIE